MSRKHPLQAIPRRPRRRATDSILTLDRRGYTKSTLLQWFGEVASNDGMPPHTDMGTRTLPANAFAAPMTTLCDVDAAAWMCWYWDQQVLAATVPT